MPEPAETTYRTFVRRGCLPADAGTQLNRLVGIP